MTASLPHFLKTSRSRAGIRGAAGGSARRCLLLGNPGQSRSGTARTPGPGRAEARHGEGSGRFRGPLLCPSCWLLSCPPYFAPSSQTGSGGGLSFRGATVRAGLGPGVEAGPPSRAGSRGHSRQRRPPARCGSARRRQPVLQSTNKRRFSGALLSFHPALTGEAPVDGEWRGRRPRRGARRKRCPRPGTL